MATLEQHTNATQDIDVIVNTKVEDSTALGEYPMAKNYLLAMLKNEIDSLPNEYGINDIINQIYLTTIDQATGTVLNFTKSVKWTPKKYTIDEYIDSLGVRKAQKNQLSLISACSKSILLAVFYIIKNSADRTNIYNFLDNVDGMVPQDIYIKIYNMLLDMPGEQANIETTSLSKLAEGNSDVNITAKIDTNININLGSTEGLEAYNNVNVLELPYGKLRFGTPRLYNMDFNVSEFVKDDLGGSKLKLRRLYGSVVEVDGKNAKCIGFPQSIFNIKYKLNTNNTVDLILANKCPVCQIKISAQEIVHSKTTSSEIVIDPGCAKTILTGLDVTDFLNAVLGNLDSTTTYNVEFILATESNFKAELATDILNGNLSLNDTTATFNNDITALSLNSNGSITNNTKNVKFTFSTLKYTLVTKKHFLGIRWGWTSWDNKQNKTISVSKTLEPGQTWQFTTLGKEQRIEYQNAISSSSRYNNTCAISSGTTTLNSTIPGITQSFYPDHAVYYYFGKTKSYAENAANYTTVPYFIGDATDCFYIDLLFHKTISGVDITSVYPLKIPQMYVTLNGVPVSFQKTNIDGINKNERSEDAILGIGDDGSLIANSPDYSTTSNLEFSDIAAPKYDNWLYKYKFKSIFDLDKEKFSTKFNYKPDNFNLYKAGNIYLGLQKKLKLTCTLYHDNTSTKIGHRKYIARAIANLENANYRTYSSSIADNMVYKINAINIQPVFNFTDKVTDKYPIVDILYDNMIIDFVGISSNNVYETELSSQKFDSSDNYKVESGKTMEYTAPTGTTYYLFNNKVLEEETL